MDQAGSNAKGVLEGTPEKGSSAKGLSEGRVESMEGSEEQQLLAQATEQAKRSKLKEHMKPDENAMTVGILNVMITAFLVGRSPQSFFVLHLLKTTVLLPWRYIRFRRQKWQWYMVEFCYFVSYATLIGCFLALLRTTTGFESVLTEYNGLLFRIGFSFASGVFSQTAVSLQHKAMTQGSRVTVQIARFLP